MTSNKKSASSSRPLRLRQSYNRERSRIGFTILRRSSGFTIVELIVAIVIIGVLATITIIAYTGIQQKAIVATLKSDLVNSTQALKLYQVEHSAYPTSINDCPSPATGNMCLKYSPNNTYPVFESINTNPQTFCLTAQSANNTRYHITEDSVPELGSCSFPFAGSLTALTASPFSIDLAWDTVDGATSYILQQDTNSSFTSASTIATITPPTATTFTSDNLLPNTQYFYRVNATVDGEVSEWSTSSAIDTTDPLDAPDAPVVTANTVDATTTWSWPGVTCASGSTAGYRYDYFIDTVSQSPSGWKTPTVPTATSIDFTTSTEGRTYSVEVQAQCFVGSNASQWSASSGQVSYYRPIITSIDLMEYSSDAIAQAGYVSNSGINYGTTDRCTGGTTTAKSYYTSGGDVDGPNAFADDGATTIWWAGPGGYDIPTWIKYAFASGVTWKISEVTITPHGGAGNAHRGPKNFTVSGSNNDTNYTLLYTGVAAGNTNLQTFTFTNTVEYRYIRIDITSLEDGNDGYGPMVEEIQMFEGFYPLQSYSEATIKQQGSYALKGIATITTSLNTTLTRTVSPTKNLSGQKIIRFDVRSSRTGTNLQAQIHDSGGTTSTHNINIASADTWQTETWDISGISDANKDIIDQIIFKVINANAANTFYVDNMVSTD